MSVPHPLEQLSLEEVNCVRDAILQACPATAIQFRSIFLHEPAKAVLAPFLAAEHGGNLNPSTPRPPRLAKVQYDIVRANRTHDYTESIVDVNAKKEVQRRMVDSSIQPSLTL
jgi:primary-amine oxidase